jgi:hypothetical protein
MVRQRLIRLFGLTFSLVLLLALTAPGALAAKPERTVEREHNVTEEFYDEGDECFPAGWVTITFDSRFQVLEFPDGRYQVTSHLRGTFVLEADDGVTYTGRFVGNYNAVLTQQTEVETFNFIAIGRGDDGSRLRIHVQGHITLVDGEPVVAFERLRC